MRPSTWTLQNDDTVFLNSDAVLAYLQPRHLGLEVYEAVDVSRHEVLVITYEVRMNSARRRGPFFLRYKHQGMEQK